MLDILFALFQTIIHSIEALINLITSIPTYIGYFMSYVATLPTFIIAPLTLAVTGAVIIKIKRLVF